MVTERSSKRAFAKRPADPDSWIKACDPQRPRSGDAAAFTARLTIDVTPELRGRIKIAAFSRRPLRMLFARLRALLAREYPENQGGDQ